MTPEERNMGASRTPTVFFPRRSFAKVCRKRSEGSIHSGSSGGSVETAALRQAARLRASSARLAHFRRSPRDMAASTEGGLAAENPSELSSHITAPGILKIFGNEICEGANYKSVLATTYSCAKALLKEALERYSLSKTEADDYVLCDVIGCVGESQWKTECLRVVGDNEKPLLLQSLWKPKEGYARRFEIHRRASVEEKISREKDTVTAGLNAQARKLQKTRSRGKSVLLEIATRERGRADVGSALWRSRSEADVTSDGPGERGKAWGSHLGEGLGEGMENKARPCLSSRGPKKSSTQFSIHPPTDFPYLLLLLGYSHSQDFIIYPIHEGQHVFGCPTSAFDHEEEENFLVDFSLWAPDILPQHCVLRRVESSPDQGMETVVLLGPLGSAHVKRNGVRLSEEAQLWPGDLVGLGEHYLLMYKDPMASEALWPSSLAPPLCNLRIPGSSDWKLRAPGKVAPSLRDTEGRELTLVFSPEEEQGVLKEIFSAAEQNGTVHSLTTSLALGLCLQQYSRQSNPDNLRRLLLLIAQEVQTATWESAKNLTAVQPEIVSQDDGEERPEKRQPMAIDELIVLLRPLAIWMANALELLHFIQLELPLLLQESPPQGEEEDDHEEQIAQLEMHLDAVRSASEKAMTVLEEVIMFTFQQCVFYLTKTLYHLLSGMLDSHPFCENGHLQVPEEVNRLLTVFKRTMEFLGDSQVHWEFTSQLFSYLFFFVNALLFNMLMEKGSGGGYYQWSHGVQIRANLDTLMDWIHEAGLGELALECLSKLSTAVNLIATPKDHLLQDSWSSLRKRFPQLNPAQLHHILRGYSLSRTCPPAWTPTAEDTSAALRTVDILESLDHHPPLILPSTGFVLELRRPVCDPILLAQVQLLQEVLNHPTPVNQQPCAAVPVEAKVTKRTPLPMAQLELGPELVWPCLTDPQDETTASAEMSSGEKEHLLSLPDSRGYNEQTDQQTERHHDYTCNNTPPEEEEGRDVTEHFSVDLERGPCGFGLSLMDGSGNQTQMTGIYIKSVLPESPAAQSRGLFPGDHILEVNGVSLAGMDCHIGKEVIQGSGDRVKLLVTRTTWGQITEDSSL
ncbi:ras-associating and dilute domain-containing protein-like isoform X2 [Denticeps clupeoides]|uniref:ras-associating and dilute domain-containing protein-like isoform X2 n=1 Tax=Denticeps clupeoides TaxID=299321 RepID=UPI0010A4776A|nr:ras-associating and dilute domain-containing protein-like isoform X2 [Denticeps clupeoides]